MSLVQVEVKKTHAELILNRIDKHNALSMELISNIVSSLDSLFVRATTGEVKTLIIRSASKKAFCAGADLKERMKMDDDQVVEALNALRILMGKIEYFPAVTVAVIEGVAFGGGLEMALACDLRFAEPSAQVGLTETKLAIIPGAGGTQRLRRLVGMAKAKELIFSAKKVLAKNNEYNLFNHVSEDCYELACDFAAEVSLAGPVALRAAKEALDGGQSLSLEDSLNWERQCYLKTLKTEDRLEALKAFTEKRKAIFKGK